MIKVLNKSKNIVSIDPDLIPGHLKGHNLIVYLPERDMIVLSGWRGSVAHIVELTSAYMEIERQRYRWAQEALSSVWAPDGVPQIMNTLDEIYRLRCQKGKSNVL